MTRTQTIPSTCTDTTLDGVPWYLIGARYYDPVVGVWTSTDPFEEFWNSYSYVGGNPINYIDQWGLFGIKIPTPADLMRRQKNKPAAQGQRPSRSRSYGVPENAQNARQPANLPPDAEVYMPPLAGGAPVSNDALNYIIRSENQTDDNTQGNSINDGIGQEEDDEEDLAGTKWDIYKRTFETKNGPTKMNKNDKGNCDHCGNKYFNAPEYKFGGDDGPCHHHDKGYGKGGTEEDRRRVDSTFREDMYRRSQNKRDSTVADIYHFFVRGFGWTTFKYKNNRDK